MEGNEHSSWSIAIHGGAGVIDRERLSSEQQSAYREALRNVVSCGGAVLSNGGSALDAVTQSVTALEDDILFNAGRGASFNLAGKNELDASVMDGSTLDAGAVAGVSGIRNPVLLARAVMEKTSHVMLIGEGAESFAKSIGHKSEADSYFFCETRWNSLLELLTRARQEIPERPARCSKNYQDELVHDEGKLGTVGAVAVDRYGNLASGTSTGGITGKKWGRVGDTPIIGAGCYADDLCAVSCTGQGEYFIRLGIARALAMRVKYGGESLQASADIMIQGELSNLQGAGGLIAVSRGGEIAWSYNTSGMYRALASEGRPTTVSLFGDET